MKLEIVAVLTILFILFIIITTIVVSIRNRRVRYREIEWAKNDTTINNIECPLKIQYRCLYSIPKSKYVYAGIKTRMLNLSEKKIKAYMISARLTDSFKMVNELVYCKSEAIIDPMTISEGNWDTGVMNVSKFVSLSVIKIAFTDDTIWENNESKNN